MRAGRSHETPRPLYPRRGGLAATSIRLDDSGELDAGIAPDVPGAHRVTASFAHTAVTLLTGPTAIDWYDRQADGKERCARVALIDTAPDHGSRTRTATRERFAGPLGDFLQWLA